MYLLKFSPFPTVQNEWARLTEEDVIEPLHSTCKKKYAAIRPRVVSLFTHEDSGRL